MTNRLLPARMPGYPIQLRGVTTYADNPGYFTEQMKKLPDLGINLIGGCCGTTPYHIRKLSDALEGVSLSRKHIDANNAAAYKKKKSFVLEKLERGEKPYVVELDPPFNLDYSKIIRGAELLKENGVDLLTPFRLSSWQNQNGCRPSWQHGAKRSRYSGDAAYHLP